MEGCTPAMTFCVAFTESKLLLVDTSPLTSVPLSAETAMLVIVAAIVVIGRKNRLLSATAESELISHTSKYGRRGSRLGRRPGNMGITLSMCTTVGCRNGTATGRKALCCCGNKTVQVTTGTLSTTCCGCCCWRLSAIVADTFNVCLASDTVSRVCVSSLQVDVTAADDDGVDEQNVVWNDGLTCCCCCCRCRSRCCNCS